MVGGIGPELYLFHRKIAFFGGYRFSFLLFFFLPFTRPNSSVGLGARGISFVRNLKRCSVSDALPVFLGAVGATFAALSNCSRLNMYAG